MAGFDIAVVALVSALAIALLVVLFVLIRRWMDRDLALSMAGDDATKRDYMLQKLEQAKQDKVPRKQLQTWLEQAAGEYAVK